MKLIKVRTTDSKTVRKKDNAADDILDGLYTLNNLHELQRLLTYCTKEDLSFVEARIKSAVANGPKALTMIANQRKNMN